MRIALLIVLLCACRGSWVPSDVTVRKNTKTEVEVALIEPVGNLSVQGFVRNWNNMRELPGVTLIVTSPLLANEHTAVADDKGVFVFSGFQPGDYAIKAVYLGNEEARAKFKIEDGKTTQITVDVDAPI